jgi:Ferritin-like domain
MTSEITRAVSLGMFERRGFLRNAGLAAVSLSVIGAASPIAAATQASSDSESDVNVMQGALAIEHEGIAAYRIAGGSGLLTPGTLKIATIFMGHHQQHRDSLEALIQKAGGTPVAPKTDSQYAQELNLAALKSEGDVIALATRLEQGATNAYAGQVAALQNRQLTHLFTQLCADEAVHWATLNNAMGVPIPAKAYLFG